MCTVPLGSSQQVKLCARATAINILLVNAILQDVVVHQDGQSTQIRAMVQNGHQDRRWREGDLTYVRTPCRVWQDRRGYSSWTSPDPQSEEEAEEEAAEGWCRCWLGRHIQQRTPL